MKLGMLSFGEALNAVKTDDIPALKAYIRGSIEHATTLTAQRSASLTTDVAEDALDAPEVPVEQRRQEKIKELLSLRDGSKKQSTLLHWACYLGNEAAVRLLVHYGADVNAAESDGKTPLHWAAFEGHRSICEWLLHDRGVDFERRDILDNTPCHLAILKDHTSVARLFPNYRVVIASQNPEGSRQASALSRINPADDSHDSDLAISTLRSGPSSVTVQISPRRTLLSRSSSILSSIHSMDPIPAFDAPQRYVSPPKLSARDQVRQISSTSQQEASSWDPMAAGSHDNASDDHETSSQRRERRRKRKEEKREKLLQQLFAQYVAEPPTPAPVKVRWVSSRNATPEPSEGPSDSRLCRHEQQLVANLTVTQPMPTTSLYGSRSRCSSPGPSTPRRSTTPNRWRPTWKPPSSVAVTDLGNSASRSVRAASPSASSHGYGAPTRPQRAGSPHTLTLSRLDVRSY